jgi:hypothetical protein
MKLWLLLVILIAVLVLIARFARRGGGDDGGRWRLPKVPRRPAPAAGHRPRPARRQVEAAQREAAVEARPQPEARPRDPDAGP